MPSIAEQALQYAKNHGLHLFPVRPNKSPITTNGFKDASTDSEWLERMFHYPNRGMGVHPGKSNFVVVDIDVKDGAQGEEEWSDLGVEFDGPEVLTPSGGRHLWFRKPEGLVLSNHSLDKSIDIRADNGYVILPDSFEYRWELGYEEACNQCEFEHPSFNLAPMFPEVLIDKLRQSQEFKPGEVDEGPIPSGSRYETLFKAGRKMRYAGVPESGIAQALLEMNRQRCQPPHPDSYIVNHILPGVMNPDDPPINPHPEQKPLIRIRHSEGGPVNWKALWDTEHPPVDWVPEMEGIAIAGRATNLYGPAGTGKSELVLHRAAKAAQAGVRVLWLDREMTDADVKQRLIEMGFSPENLAALTYILYPDVPLLDKPDGGAALVALADTYASEVVVIDSLSKFVRDEEGETHTSFYLHTIMPMRMAGHAFVMIDHTGKDLARQARGASQKTDNVDYYTELTRQYGVGAKLTTKKQRHSWVQPAYTYRRFTSPLDYRLSAPRCVFNCGNLATRRGGPKNQWLCDTCNPPQRAILSSVEVPQREKEGEDHVQST